MGELLDKFERASKGAVQSLGFGKLFQIELLDGLVRAVDVVLVGLEFLLDEFRVVTSV